MRNNLKKYLYSLLNKKPIIAQEKCTYSYHIKNLQSPTCRQLKTYLQNAGWLEAEQAQDASFSDKHLEFESDAAQTLEYKHLLAALCQRYCPESIPETWHIHDQNWPWVLEQIARENKAGDNHCWILSPCREIK